MTALTSAVGLVLAGLIILWVIEGIDAWLLSDRLQRHGIHPRDIDELDGILWSPFLHSGWEHLVSNSFTYLALGALVAIRGRRYWLLVTLFSAVFGGGLTWLFAAGGNHIGASGVVFGYLGALIGAAVFERRLAAIGPALIAMMFYSGMAVGFVPQDGISWEGHIFGALAGFVAAKLLATPRPPPPELTDEEIGFDWD